MIYEAFSMRLSKRHDEVNQEPSWTVVLGRNGLEHFYVGDVDNPMPEPKTSYEEIPGRNGENDLTEAAGRVFYNRKTITVTLQGDAAFKWMDEIEDIFRPYQGRVCDFAFESPGQVEWFYTGRLSFNSNRFRNRVVLIFDTEPLMTNVALTTNHIPVSPKIDKNSFGWDYAGTICGGNVGGATYSYGEHIIAVATEPGSIIEFTRQEEAGTVFAIGIVDAVGGDVYFHNIDNESTVIEDNRVVAIADDSDLMRMRVVVDGSYYSWVTDNGEDYYLPTCRITYRMANLEDGISFLNSDQSAEFPANVLIEPEISVTGNSVHVLIDGKAVSPLYVNGRTEDAQGAVIPGNRAYFGEENAVAVFAAVRQTSSDADSGTTVLISYHEKRVG